MVRLDRPQTADQGLCPFGDAADLAAAGDLPGRNASGAIYFDPVRTFACYSGVLFSEVLDPLLIPQVRRPQIGDHRAGPKILTKITINTVFSAGEISFFVINVARQLTIGGHFTPLFFLFAASLFAAMNNNQMIGILLLRLTIYTSGLVYITFCDIVKTRPPLVSNIWLEFFTIVFVLHFIIGVSLVFCRNCQERPEQWKRIRGENERTRAVHEIKSPFLSTVSHELRTPPTSIMPSPDLLDPRKIEAGEMVFHFETNNVGELVKEANGSTVCHGDQTGTYVTMAIPKDEVQIRGDQPRLIQVINGLLSNALKFSREGGTVQRRVEPREDRVRICVQDEGTGIRQNAHDRVFGKLSQVDGSDIRKTGGTGPGMNIARLIVERHDGREDCESERGQGSTLYGTFDRIPSGAKVEADDEPLAVPAQALAPEA